MCARVNPCRAPSCWENTRRSNKTKPMVDSWQLTARKMHPRSRICSLLQLSSLCSLCLCGETLFLDPAFQGRMDYQQKNYIQYGARTLGPSAPGFTRVILS